MGALAQGQPHGNARSRLMQAVACAFACAASSAGPQAQVPAPAPRPAASGSAAQPAEGASPRVLYFEEGGGIVTTPARPPGAARQPLPPPPENDGKAAVPAAPSKAPGAGPKPAPASSAKPSPTAQPAPPPVVAPRAAAEPKKAASPAAPGAPAAPATPVPDLHAQWGEKVDRANDESNQDALVSLADAPGASYGCAEAYRGWAVAEALASAGQQSRAARILEPLASACDTPTRLSTLEQARRSVPRGEYLRWEAREAKAARDPQGDKRFRRLVHERVMDERTMAKGTPRERAEQLAKDAGESTVEFHDTGSAVYMGWLWLEAGDAANANLWFERGLAWTPGSEDAITGIARAAIRSGDHARALAFADRLPQGNSERANIRRDALVGLAQRDYEAKRYAEAARGLEMAAREGRLPRYAQSMQAWCSYNLGDREAAAARFATLYRDSHDRESAEGLVAASGRGVGTAYPDLAATEPLRAMLAARSAEDAFRNGRYLEARALDPKRWAEAGSPGTFNALLGEGTRKKSGEPGLGKLRQSPWTAIDAAAPLGERASVAVRAERTTLDAGTLEPNALVGSAPAGSGPTPAFATKATIDEASVAIRHESEAAISMLLGRGPDGGPLGARTFGALEYAATPAWGQLAASIFAEPVRETVLSYAGMRDPWTGTAWGGVQRRGGELRLLRLRDAPWTAGLRLRYERLDGTLVQDNARAVGDVTFGRDLGLKGFAYSAVSLYGGYESYRHNLSGFTLGHGGYFSPQRYGRVGAALDFMTEEDRRWLVRGRVSGGWFTKRDDATPVLPLDPDGRAYAGASNNGHEAALRLGAVVLAGSRVQLGAVVGRSISPAYSENIARAEIRVLFEPRRSVVAADLPTGRGY